MKAERRGISKQKPQVSRKEDLGFCNRATMRPGLFGVLLHHAALAHVLLGVLHAAVHFALRHAAGPSAAHVLRAHRVALCISASALRERNPGSANQQGSDDSDRLDFALHRTFPLNEKENVEPAGTLLVPSGRLTA